VSAPSFPVFDLAEIAQESAERAGIDFRSGYALRTARRSLELLSIEWANRGLNLWTIEGPISISLQSGIYQYYLPEDTVDLIEHTVRTWYVPYPPAPPGPGTNPTPYSDQPLDRMTISEYAAIPNKLARGRPTIIHIRRQIKPYFVLWMVPPVSPFYQLIVWRLRRMKSLGAGGTGQPEIPWRFIPAMIAGLAYYMSMKSKDPNATQRVELLKAAYEEQFGLASDEDRDRASIHWVPGGYERI
jgi:hypothetical protein